MKQETPDQLTCKQLVELVTDSLELALTDAQRIALAEHLADCPLCVAFVEQLLTTRRLTAQLRDAPLAPALRIQLLDAYRSWQSESS